MQQFYHYLTFLLTFTIFLTFYYNYTDINLPVEGETANYYTKSAGVKHIVAYSFLKQLETETTEVKCPRNNFGNYRSSHFSGNGKFVNGQWMRIEDTKVYLYSTHLDYRIENLVYVRFMAIIEDNWNATLFCKFSSTSSQTIIPASRINMWSDKWENHDSLIPVLFSCPFNKSLSFTSVSLTKNPCEQSPFTIAIQRTNSDVRTNYDYKDDFRIAVCVKPLNFHSVDILKKLVAWLELNHILGVDYVEVYFTNVPYKVLKVLKWYQRVRKLVNLYKFNEFSRDDANDNSTKVWRRRKSEVIVYNDCFYRNIHRVDFVIPLDIDEVILPNYHRNYKHLLKDLSTSTDGDSDILNRHSSISLRNTYFFEPNNHSSLYLFDNVQRTPFSSPFEAGKSFIQTSNTLSVFNHYALASLYRGVSRTYFLGEDWAQLNHYRAGCDAVLSPDCQEKLVNRTRVFDDGMKRFQAEFEQRFKYVNSRLKIGNIL